MASNQSTTETPRYPFVVNPKSDKFTLSEHITLRGAQIRLCSALAGDDMAHGNRETLHALVLELGLQQRMLKAAL